VEVTAECDRHTRLALHHSRTCQNLGCSRTLKGGGLVQPVMLGNGGK
jgi:hypothetical protein